MGCASSKPSSSSKKSKKNDSKTIATNGRKGSKQHQQQQQQTLYTSPETKRRNSYQANKGSISMSDELFTQITRNQKDITDFIFTRVKIELNDELLHHDQYLNNHYGPEKKPNLAQVALLASKATDNDEMIMEVSTRAITLVQLEKCGSTYQNLLDSLLSNKFLCGKQQNKIRICELTGKHLSLFNLFKFFKNSILILIYKVDIIRDCLNLLNESNHTSNNNNNIDIMEYLRLHLKKSQKDSTHSTDQTSKLINTNHLQTTPVTPPDTPEWLNNAVPLTRIQANYIARIMFLSSRARPIVHASPLSKEAYIVNREIDGTNKEITLTQKEIDDILYTFKEANSTITSSYQTPVYKKNDIVNSQTANANQSKLNYYSNGTVNDRREATCLNPLTPDSTPKLTYSQFDDDNNNNNNNNSHYKNKDTANKRDFNSQLELEANESNLDSFHHNTLNEEETANTTSDNNETNNLISNSEGEGEDENTGYDIERNIQTTTTRTTELTENEDGETVVVDETLNVEQIEEPAKVTIKTTTITTTTTVKSINDTNESYEEVEEDEEQKETRGTL
jgi:hypothetical protein